MYIDVALHYLSLSLLYITCDIKIGKIDVKC